MEVFLLTIEYDDNGHIVLNGITSTNDTVDLVVRDFKHHCLIRKVDASPKAPLTVRPTKQPSQCELRTCIDGYGYHEPETFLYLADTDQKIIQSWVDYYKAAFAEDDPARVRYVYNTSLSPVAQFMMLTGFHGAGWIQITGATKVDGEDIYEVSMDGMNAMEGNVKYPPSMRVASFDIETVHNRSCQIATAFYVLDDHLKLLSRRIVAQTLRRAHAIKDAEVRYYGRNRTRMYEEWVEMMREFKPHIIIGYNIKNFDIPTMIADASACGISAADFSFASKTLQKEVVVRPSMKAKCRAQGGSKQSGARKQTDVSIHGVVVMDVYEAVINNDKKHKSNKLKYVAQALLGYTKLDVDYADIPRYLADEKEGWDVKMTEMLDYNKWDAILPFDIAEVQKNFGDMIAMSRVAGGQLEWVYGRGQTCKAVALISRQMHLLQYVMPDMRKPKEQCAKDSKDAKEERYEGAVVLDPKPGIYDYLKDATGKYMLDEKGEKIPAFVTTVDFASLYPSIIRAFNFCFTTLCLSGIAPEGVECYLSEFKALFVKKEHRRGVLPRILDVLTDNRASVRGMQKKLVAAEAKALAAAKEGTPAYEAAKAALEAATETPEYQALECMQLAIKRVSNSLYGATGSPNFFMPCVQIAASVTAEGRKNIIQKTKPFIEAKYPGCIIVYGDTDSVFVVLGLHTMEETMAAGKELAALITAHINCPPIKLEWEKVLWPAVFTTKKKNYYGRYWTNPKYFDKLYVRGLAFIKSSTCAFMKDACTTVCEMIAMKMRPMEEVLAFVRQKCAELWTIAKSQGRANTALLDSLLLYMKNGKDTYAVENGITELIRKNNVRGNAPIELGERVPYFVIKTPETEMAYRVEHESYVRAHPEIEIDVQYYVDKQWRNTLHNLMPGYEAQADEALLPPSQRNILAFGQTYKIVLPEDMEEECDVQGSATIRRVAAGNKAAFEAFHQKMAEKRKKEEEQGVVAVEPPVKKRKKQPSLKRQAAPKEEEPVKRPMFASDFFQRKK